MSSPSVSPLEEAYERCRAHVGHRRRIHLGRLDERDLRRFALVIGHTAADVYTDAQAASAAGLPGLPAAPLFLSAVLGWEAGPAEDELLPDGNSRTPFGDLPLDGLRLMGGGQDLTFHAPVVAGIDVTMEETVHDVVHKHGRTGPLLVIEIHRSYLDERDTLLVECRESFLAR